MNWIGDKVDEFNEKELGCCCPSSKCEYWFETKVDHIEATSNWLRTALEEAFLQGRDISMKADEVLREEGRADCKHKAETAALMALNACGVPEEEAVKHAHIAVDSVF